VYAGTAAETAKQVVSSVIQEFRELKQELISEDELRRAKDHLKGSLMLSLESTSSRMSNLARQELYFDKFMTMDDMLESIERVERAEVQAIAQAFFRTEDIALAMLGKLGDIAVTREDLVC
jgi:predicted Zn-dependent peptidase